MIVTKRYFQMNEHFFKICESKCSFDRLQASHSELRSLLLPRKISEKTNKALVELVEFGRSILSSCTEWAVNDALKTQNFCELAHSLIVIETRFLRLCWSQDGKELADVAELCMNNGTKTHSTLKERCKCVYDIVDLCWDMSALLSPKQSLEGRSKST